MGGADSDGPVPAEATAIDVAAPSRRSATMLGAALEKPSDAEIAQAAAAAVAAASPPPASDEQWYRAQIDYVRMQVEQIENSGARRGQQAKNIRSEWRRRLFLLFEDPSSSRAAFVLNLLVTLMIILSAALTTIETIPSLRKGHAALWLAFELTIVVVFTVEFVLRFLAHTDSWRQAWAHAKSPVTIIDALAIFPFYIELILQRDTSYEFRFTILRIFRLLRVFSAFKYSSLLQLSIEVMIVAIKRSADALLAFLLFVALTVLLFSTLMYFAERGTWDEERQAFLTPEGEYSKFSSIPAAAYYAIVTLTTTGFGDMVPTTFIGKLISFPMMIAGILLIALPSIIVGRNFTQVWEAARKLRTPRPPSRAPGTGGAPVAEYDDDDEDDEQQEDSDGARSSARGSSRRSRMRRRRTPRRSGSVSSFEGASVRSARSAHEHAGGYVGLSGGQHDAAARASKPAPSTSADPIDALARKDSIEMQELARKASIEMTALAPRGRAADAQGPEERAGGYRQLDASDDAPEPGDSPIRSRARGSAKARGKAREPPAAAVQVPQQEWAALKAEVEALRSAIAGNERVLQAIASHLSAAK
ncbi:hypothetical protein H4R18_005249 [Coemansia javaensis]|uniref:Ion transport domain-containing protein n=1 Tax=Coemansia javaensis TaxID=2761396 RepID=A0A9W8H359_9FUNG|nr:hypothetical protein H4R18_005249 [Coemansia javaensis]